MEGSAFTLAGRIARRSLPGLYPTFYKIAPAPTRTTLLDRSKIAFQGRVQIILIDSGTAWLVMKCVSFRPRFMDYFRVDA